MTEKTQDDQKNEIETDSAIVPNSIEDIVPITYEEMRQRALYSFTGGYWGHSFEQIDETFSKYLGEDFDRNNVTQRKYRKKLFLMSEDLLKQRLYDIKTKGTSLIDENINFAMSSTLDLLAVRLDLSETPLEDCKKIIKQRSEGLEQISDTCEVLWVGRRLFDWYRSGVVSPEINSDILKMQDLYRNGVIDCEVLAMYYYNVALAYDKYSSQKNTQQAISNEHFRSVKFMKEALNKTENNISLVMTVKNLLSDEPNYDPQLVLDACHRIMDNNNDDRSLYLAHKLYAETLSESKKRKIKGFSSQNGVEKVIEHYRTALSYTSLKEDKLDILEAIADHQPKGDNDGYIDTQLEIICLLSGRKRIRAIKDLVYKIESRELKIELLEGAINEFADLKEIRREDLPLYNSLDTKLRALVADDPKTLKKLDVLRKKFSSKHRLPPTQKSIPTRMSSKGHDLFSK